jgi:hypothetical protein
MKQILLFLLLMVSVAGFGQIQNHGMFYRTPEEGATGTYDCKIVVTGFNSITCPIFYKNNNESSWSTISPKNSTNGNNPAVVRGDKVVVQTYGSATDVADYTLDYFSTYQSTPASRRYGQCADISADGSTLVLSSSFSSLVDISTDGGSTWTTSNTGFATRYGIAVSGTGDTIWTTGYTAYEYLRYSFDSGATWNSTGTVAYAISIDCSIDGKYVYVGSHSGTEYEFYVSTDGGSTFTGVNLVSGPAYASSISCSDNGQYVLAYSFNGLKAFVSNDYGSTWTEVLSGVTTKRNLYTNKFVSASGRYMVIGDSSVQKRFYISDDCGVTWDTVDVDAMPSLLIMSPTVND